MSRTSFVLPLILIFHMIDFTDRKTLNFLRFVFACSIFFVCVARVILKHRVVAHNDNTIAYWPQDILFGVSVIYHERTYLEYERELAEREMKSALSTAGFACLLSFVFNIHIVMGLQILLLPLGCLDSKLFQKYILVDPAAWKALKKGDDSARGFYNERISKPVTEGRGGRGGGSSQQQQQQQRRATNTSAAAANYERLLRQKLGEHIKRAWDAGKAGADFRPILRLIEKGGCEADTVVSEDGPQAGWTALMIACGIVSEPALEAVEELLHNEASCLAHDGDGWTALHWAVCHGNFPAVRALLDNAEDCGGDAAVAALLSAGGAGSESAATAADGTALQLAEREAEKAEKRKRESKAGEAKAPERETENVHAAIAALLREAEAGLDLSSSSNSSSSSSEEAEAAAAGAAAAAAAAEVKEVDEID